MSRRPEEDVEVKKFACICKTGKARLLSVIEPDKKPSKESKKEWANLIAAGCDVTTITLEEARKTEMCFDCKL